MVVHWRKQHGKHFLKYSVTNILGAAICYTIVADFVAFRLRDIWPFFRLSLFYYGFSLSIKNHYNKVAKQLRLNEKLNAWTMQEIWFRPLLGMLCVLVPVR